MKKKNALFPSPIDVRSQSTLFRGPVPLLALVPSPSITGQSGQYQLAVGLGFYMQALSFFDLKN